MSNLTKSKLFQRPVPRLGEMSSGVNKLWQKVEEDESIKAFVMKSVEGMSKIVRTFETSFMDDPLKFLN